MTDTLIEQTRDRVARAICLAEFGDGDPTPVPDKLMPATWKSANNKADYRRMADAAMAETAARIAELEGALLRAALNSTGGKDE